MNLFELNAETRHDKGKGASRRLRREADKIPAILYGGDEQPTPLTLNHSEVVLHTEHEAFYSHVLSLLVDGKKQKVILKDIQRHPFKPKVLHMDFQRVSGKDTIHMSVPIHFMNEDKCIGVKAGGQIQHHLNTLDITCKANDLPEYIEVDIEQLDVNGVIHLTDVQLPKGVEITALIHGDDHDLAVASVHRRGGGSDEEESTSDDEETEES